MRKCVKAPDNSFDIKYPAFVRFPFFINNTTMGEYLKQEIARKRITGWILLSVYCLCGSLFTHTRKLHTSSHKMYLCRNKRDRQSERNRENDEFFLIAYS